MAIENNLYSNITLSNIDSMESVLLVIPDHQFASKNLELLKNIIAVNNHIKLLPLSMKVCGILSESGVNNYINYGDFITTSLLENVMVIKNDLWMKWHQQIELEFEFEGVDLFYCDDILRSWFFEDYPYLHLLFNNIFQQLNVKNVVLFSKETIYLPEYIEMEDLPYFIIAGLQKKFNYSMHRFGSESFSNIQTRPRFLAASDEIREIPHPVSQFGQKVGIVMSGLKDTEAIFNSFVKIGFDTYPIVGAFCDPNDVYEGPNQVIKMGAFYSQLLPENLKLQIEELWQQFLSRKDELSYQFIFANPLLEPVFKSIFFERLPHLFKTASKIKLMLERYRFNYICVCDHSFPETVIIKTLANKIGSHVLVFPHSSWPIHTQPWLGDCQILTWNRLSKTQWQRMKGNNKVSIIGSPRFWKKPGTDNNNSNTNKKLKLLYVTNTVEYSLRPITDLNTHFRSLQKLFDIPISLGSRIQLNVKLKVHFENIEMYQSLCKYNKSSSAIKLSQTDNLFDLIDESDIVIGWNLLSTAHLEAISRDKPVLIIKDAPLFYDAEPLLPELIFNCIRSDDFWPKIKTIIDNPSLLSTMRNNQVKWLESQIPRGEHCENLKQGLIELGHEIS